VDSRDRPAQPRFQFLHTAAKFVTLLDKMLEYLLPGAVTLALELTAATGVFAVTDAVTQR
jgi:hypothetical protein